MAFKSEAHKQRLQDLVRQGIMTQAEYDKHEMETTEELPPRITPPKIKPVAPPTEQSYHARFNGGKKVGNV